MAIDDNLVITLLDKLHVKLKETTDAERQIGALINSLLSIRKLDDGSLPIDTGTNETITEERRQAILESIIPMAVQLVGGT